MSNETTVNTAAHKSTCQIITEHWVSGICSSSRWASLSARAFWSLLGAALPRPGAPVCLAAPGRRRLGGLYRHPNLPDVLLHPSDRRCVAHSATSSWEKNGAAFIWCLDSLSQMGLNLYAQTFGLYFCELFGGGNEKLVAAIMITFFYVLNFFGVDFMSKAQNLMSITLLLALIWFTVRGLPRVDWANFFGGEGWMTNGWGGLFATSTLLDPTLLMGATSLSTAFTWL